MTARCQRAGNLAQVYTLQLTLQPTRHIRKVPAFSVPTAKWILSSRGALIAFSGLANAFPLACPGFVISMRVPSVLDMRFVSSENAVCPFSAVSFEPPMQHPGQFSASKNAACSAQCNQKGISELDGIWVPGNWRKTDFGDSKLISISKAENANLRAGSNSKHEFAFRFDWIAAIVVCGLVFIDLCSSGRKWV